MLFPFNPLQGAMITALRLCLIAGAILFAGASGARAQTCNYSISNVAFGTIDLTGGLAADSTGTLTVSCTGLANRVVRVCPNIGSGSGGDTGSGSPRKMVSGANSLLFTLYSDPARSIVWGSAVWPWTAQYNVPTLDLSLSATGNASQTYTIYGRVLGGQSAVPNGSYASSFSGNHTLFSAGYSTVGNCAAISATGGAQPSFNVSANVARTCNLTTAPLNFGTQGSLSSNIDGSAQLRLTCSPGVAYTVGLDGGTSGTTSPTQRKLAQGTKTITYGLYGDAARALPWFNTSAFYQGGGTATGSAQTLTVYGRIPAQVTPPPGVYTDNIVVTVTY